MLEEGKLKNSMLHALCFALFFFPQVCDVAKFKNLVKNLQIKKHKNPKKIKMKTTGFEAISKAGGMWG